MAISTSDPTRFAPTAETVRLFEATRAATLSLNDRLVKTIPRRALDEVGAALGLLGHDGSTFVFPYEQAADLLMDGCLHAWPSTGPTPVQRFRRRYAETGEPRLDEGEARVLEATSRVKHRTFRIDEVLAGAGARATDGRTGEEFVLMDATLGRSPHAVGVWLAAHVLPFGDWHMTTGAPVTLGLASEQQIRSLHRAFETGDDPSETSLRAAALGIVSVGIQIQAEARAEAPEPPAAWPTRGPTSDLPQRPPGRNDPCPCGSGRKYKRCCAQ